MSTPDTIKKIITTMHNRTFNQKGQSIIIITFAFLGLIAMLGLALDLALVYIEQGRIKRAVDAATLAGVVELPNEEQSFLRAISYLDQNGYNLQDTNGNDQINVYVRGCSHNDYLSTTGLANNGTDGLTSPSVDYTTDGHLYYPPGGTPVPDPVAEFILDTRSYQSTDGSGNYMPAIQLCDQTSSVFGTANKFHIIGRVPVRMNFMQFFGFGRVSVGDNSVAQNITQLDISVVFDMSGSMQFDTVCHGCYEQFDDGMTIWQDFDYGYQYPILDTDNGRIPKTFIFPIPTDHLPKHKYQTGGISGLGDNDGELCFSRDGNSSVPVSSAALRSIVIEAELYTRNNSIYDTSFRQPGRGYWAIQHATYRMVDKMMDSNHVSDSNGDGIDDYLVGATPVLPGYSRGSWVAHHPFMSEAVSQIGSPGDPWYVPAVPFGKNYGSSDAYANTSPSLDYEFFTSDDWSAAGNDTRIWMRAQGGNIYWAVYETPPGPGFDAMNPAPVGGVIQRNHEGTNGDPMYGGAQADQWTWAELTDGSPLITLNNNTKYTLRIWAGSAGFDLDQIVIGNSSDTSIFGSSTNYDDGVTTPANPLLHATPGSAFGQACNRCNPIYGQVIDAVGDCSPPNDNGASLVSAQYLDSTTGKYDLRKDEIFGGYQPIRAVKESLKRFAGSLNPQFDQIGVVAYNSSTSSDRAMDLRCLRSNPNDCFVGANPITYTQVLKLIEKYPANGSTNIAQGMRDGLYLLGIDADNRGGSRPSQLPSLPVNCSGLSCSRGASAKRVMILMTDGVANVYPSGMCDSDPTLYTPDMSTNTGNTNTDASNDNLNRSRDCAMWYATIGSSENVIIYTIGLGNGADVALLEAVADEGSGQYFAAATPAKLDEIFDTILKSVSVRLIQ